MPTTFCRRRRAAAAGLAAVIGASVIATASPPAHATTQALTVVAVGDSYASGEGAIGGLGATWISALCHRSSLAGPQNAAARLFTLRPGSFTSLACSGSTTGSTFGSGSVAAIPQKRLIGAGGQLSGLGSMGRIDALTMSIGGNDLGFAGIVRSCMLNPIPCSIDRAVTGPLAAAFSSLPTRLDAVAAAVPSNVANVFVTEYPDPTTGPGPSLCGTPATPAFQGLEGITGTEAAFASAALVAPLNANLAAMVARANSLPGRHPVWHFVSGVTARFVTHGYCTGVAPPVPPFTGSPVWVWFTPRYINTLVDSLTSQVDADGTMHPNDLGQQAIGEALFDAMRFLAQGLAFTPSTSATPIIGVPVNVSVAVRTQAGTPAVGATVLIDGVATGTTDQTGRLTTNVTFGSIGAHSIAIDLDPYPVISTTLHVHGRAYSVSSAPNPIPVGKTIPSLTLSAHDGAGAIVPGTFTITGGNTVSVRSGVPAANQLVTMSFRWVIEEGPTGKPVKVKEPVCPTLRFVPDDTSVFSTTEYIPLIGC